MRQLVQNGLKNVRNLNMREKNLKQNESLLFLSIFYLFWGFLLSSDPSILEDLRTSQLKISEPWSRI